MPFRWDDEQERDVLDVNSPVMKRITKFTGDADKAAAGVYAMLAGQESDLVVDPKVKKTLKRMGIDPDDTKAMYRASFPGDFGEPENQFSRIADEYNRLRQENLMKKVRDIEAKGGVALIAPGATHAWQLAPVLSGRS